MKKPEYFYILIQDKSGVFCDELRRFEDREAGQQYLRDRVDERFPMQEITARKATALIKAYRQATGGHGGEWQLIQNGRAGHFV